MSNNQVKSCNINNNVYFVNNVIIMNVQLCSMASTVYFMKSSASRESPEESCNCVPDSLALTLSL